jgi:hypothetical protein
MKLMRLSIFTLCAGLLLWNGPAARAQTTPQTLYHVTVDPSQLQSHPAGLFSLEFSLIDGTGLGEGNSTVVVTNFNFGTNGAYNGDPSANSGVSGDLSSAVTLVDTAPESDFWESFIPGNTLTFDVYATLTLEANGVSDEFDISILDANIEPIPTLDTISNNVLVRMTTSNGVAITVASFSTDPSTDPIASGPPLSFAPQVLLSGTHAPPGRPTLSISRITNGTATVQWPAVYSNFTLEETPDLVNWSFVPTPETLVGTNFDVIVYPSDAPAEFYRLAQ